MGVQQFPRRWGRQPRSSDLRPTPRPMSSPSEVLLSMCYWTHLHLTTSPHHEGPNKQFRPALNPGHRLPDHVHQLPLTPHSFPIRGVIRRSSGRSSGDPIKVIFPVFERLQGDSFVQQSTAAVQGPRSGTASPLTVRASRSWFPGRQPTQIKVIRPTSRTNNSDRLQPR